jgi:hydroxymethylglutaryl-CoA reductase (NADPH)
MLGCAGSGHARKFAEICATVVLAGELAIVGAMASGQFASAHASGGRKRLAAGDERPVNGAATNGVHKP